MAEEVRLWSVSPEDALVPVSRAKLDLEARLERWLEREIDVLDPELLVIGKQVQTDFGGIIDLLCLHRSGDIVVLELKRDKTPREITAQALDYGSWVRELPAERIREMAEGFLPEGLQNAFEAKFGSELPDSINENHRLLIVGSEIDPSSERIIRYLSGTYGVSINAARFQYFRTAGGQELLARIFLIEPERVEHQSRTIGTSKRLPNLTYEELQSLADEQGVGELYRRAVEKLGVRFYRSTSRSSIRFMGDFSGSRKVVLSFVPKESSREKGLYFQIYTHRLAALSGVAVERFDAILPRNIEAWTYIPGSSEEWGGYHGYFGSLEEVETLLRELDGAMGRGVDDGRPNG
jgi:hypothetical protein